MLAQTDRVAEVVKKTAHEARRCPGNTGQRNTCKHLNGQPGACVNQAGPAWQRQRKQVQCTPQLSPGRARAAPAARAASRPTTPTSDPRPGMRGGAAPEQGEGAAGVAEGVGVRGQGAGGEQVGARLVLALAGLVQGDGALRRHGADPAGGGGAGAGGRGRVVGTAGKVLAGNWRLQARSSSLRGRERPAHFSSAFSGT